MLSDEEKKAIENLRLNVTNVGFSVYDGTTSLFKMRDIQIVLNLIEKQSKEIEELKNGQIDFWISDKEIEERIRNKFVSKDKIKAKIEEYEDYGTSIYYGLRSNGKAFQQAVRTEVKNILQSLLEKE